MQPENQHTYRAIDEHGRRQDPLDTVGVLREFDDTQLATDAHNDIVRVDNILETDQTLTSNDKQELYELGVNLRLDWLYADGGGRDLPIPQFAAEVKATEAFIKGAAAHAFKKHEKHPQDFWALQTKLLDLKTFASHRFAEDSQTTLKGTESGQKLFGLAQGMMKGVMGESIRLMKDMEKVSDGPEDVAQDARGSLYELMLLTYSRLNVYNEQTFDTIFVRSALSREDRPWNNHAYPKRAFDIVIESPQGAQLLQAKNHRNDDEYEWPIQKVQDEHFRKTLHELPKYVVDFSLILDNPRDPRLKGALIKAQRRLDDVFGRQLELAH